MWQIHVSITTSSLFIHVYAIGINASRRFPKDNEWIVGFIIFFTRVLLDAKNPCRQSGPFPGFSQPSTSPIKMARTRVSRSKTGCQTCRRRKVRCDEAKPVCTACARLDFVCIYGAGPITEAPGRSRVRFIPSTYTKLSNHPPQQQKDQPGQADINITSPVTESQRKLTCDQPEDPLQLLTPSPAPAAAPPQLLEEPSLNTTCEPFLIVGNGSDSDILDLNINFDLFTEDWPSFPQTIVESPATDSSFLPIAFGSNHRDAPVIIEPDDHNLIQHYLNIMTRFTKIRCSGDENIYSQIFSNMALFYAPLYHSIIAWTALHLGQTRQEPSMVQKAEIRYDRAIELLNQDQEVANHFELSLVTLWFALQFELLAARGVENFCRHLQFTADLLYAHRRHRQAGGEATTLGPIGSRILVWLGSYDARAAWVGDAGHLLQNLELFRFDHDFLDDAFPDDETSTAGTTSLKRSLRLTVQLDIIEGRVANLYHRKTTAPVATWSALQDDLISIQEQLEDDDVVAPILSVIAEPRRSLTGEIGTRGFNSLLLLASFYSDVISFYRTLPEDMNMPKKLMTADMAAVRIIRIASCICRLRRPSPQNIWPRILFLAGIETTDIVYQDWVLKTLAEGELWGVNVGKTRILADNVIREQSKQGTRVDYLELMKHTTTLFIV